MDGHKCRLHLEEPGVCISKKMLSPARRRDVVRRPTPKVCVKTGRRGISNIGLRRYGSGKFVYSQRGFRVERCICVMCCFCGMDGLIVHSS